MGLIQRLIDYIRGSRETPAPRRSPRSRTIRAGDASSYSGNEDILDGLEFVATLNLDTPLAVLEHHGEVFRGPPDQAPEYGDPSQGIWLPKIDWKGSGLDMPKRGPMASQIGRVPQDGGSFLPFLKDFRRIVESSAPVEEKIREIKALRTKSQDYANIARTLAPNFPEKWFWKTFQVLPGIGEENAKNLFRAGYRNLADLRGLRAEDLCKVKGIGPKSAATILESLAWELREAQREADR